MTASFGALVETGLFLWSRELALEEIRLEETSGFREQLVSAMTRYFYVLLRERGGQCGTDCQLGSQTPVRAFHWMIFNIRELTYTGLRHIMDPFLSANPIYGTPL